MSKTYQANNNLIAEEIARGSAALSKYSLSPRLDCLILLEFILDKDRSWLLSNQSSCPLDWRQKKQFDQLLSLRIKHTPIAHIIGQTEFFGLKLHINKHVLVPRPETEELVEAAIELATKNARVADIGTGSGAIALAIRSARDDLSIIASDISTEALNVAKKNISEYSFHDIELIESDLISDINDKFDLITANLPYLERGIDNSQTISQEPDLALFSSAKGLEHYSILLSQIKEKDSVDKNGYLIIEAKRSQHSKIIELAANAGFIHENNYKLREGSFVLVLTKT